MRNEEADDHTCTHTGEAIHAEDLGYDRLVTRFPGVCDFLLKGTMASSGAPEQLHGEIRTLWRDHHRVKASNQSVPHVTHGSDKLSHVR